MFRVASRVVGPAVLVAALVLTLAVPNAAATWTPTSMVAPQAPCEISLSRITGAARDKAGFFTPPANPHEPGRIFLDTVAGGEILANPDEQSILLEVQLGPAGLDPAAFAVQWEVRDPDDPADHVDVDPNDGGTPTGGTARGGDNVDTLPEETTDGRHFFRQANHAISNRASPGSDGTSDATVIGQAQTAIDANRRSSVRFHYGDEAGDNYIIKAICLRIATGAEEASDETGILTVWRKRFFVLNAMSKPADDQQLIAVGTAGADANAQCVGPGANGFADTFLRSDDKYADNNGSAVRVGANLNSNTPANDGGPSYLPLLQTALVLRSLKASYASTTPNRACYLDPVLTSLSLRTTYLGVMAAANGVNANTQEHTYSRTATRYHGGGAANNTHPNNTYHVLGIRTYGATGSLYGNSTVDPHSYVDLLAHYQDFEQGGTTVSEMGQTTVHELGHSILREPDDIHGPHSPAPFTACCGSVAAGQGTQWCPRHVRQIRNNVTRSWADHDANVANPSESARDSD
ncbi:MAG: hypothetical protein HZA53_12295 [Planctomycetes bacterium]|nr:hypothetical protein [Planctomycetota bacterium]